MNVPSSSVTTGGVAYVVGAAKAVAVAAQRVKSFARRNVMGIKDNEWRMLRETYGHHEGV
jgi:hypothetical protein